MKKIRPFLFVCMFVLLSLSLTACAGRKNGNMNETSRTVPPHQRLLRLEMEQEQEPGKMA